MNKEQFKKLYHILVEQNQSQQKKKDQFIVQFDIQQTKFAFFKNEDGRFICKFSFEFLDQPQRVTVTFNGKKDLEFKIDDAQDNEQIYAIKKFKQYFNPQYTLFKEAFDKFKQFLESKQKLQTEKNVLTIIPLSTLMHKEQNKQTKINIKDTSFTFNEIANTFKDTFRVDFELAQIDNLDLEKYITAIFKAITNQNYYILEVYLTKTQNDIENATKLSKDQFSSKYPTYFEKLNKAIQTFLQLNH